MKFVGLSLRETSIESYQETRDSIDIRWYNFLKEMDLCPILIPNDIECSNFMMKQLNLSAVFISGGGESPRRQNVEDGLIHFCIQKKVPLVGVCHGMQMIHQFFGGKLKPVKNQVQTRQEIIVNRKKRIVNSYHNFALDKPLDCFDAFAVHSKSQTIKGIRHKSEKILGLMWHPERMQNRTLDQELILKFLDKNV